MSVPSSAFEFIFFRFWRLRLRVHLMLYLQGMLRSCTARASTNYFSFPEAPFAKRLMLCHGIQSLKSCSIGVSRAERRAP
ncbi:hypothetical protein SUGI_0123780 [Cryptomeria japonica]|nr:hypothetical protein SUGI_0123780 [Cryptomeria japonica]